jgi:hypothetical protein
VSRSQVAHAYFDKHELRVEHWMGTSELVHFYMHPWHASMFGKRYDGS